MSDRFAVLMRTRCDVPGDVAERLVGRPDDDSPEWIESFEQALADDPSMLLAYAIDSPEIEAL